MNNDSQTLIIYEDRYIIVCRKPAGIPVQTSRVGTKDLESILRNHLSQSNDPRTAKTPSLHIIHRLDQPVEGLLVFAKTAKAARELNRQLTGSGFGKYYLAEVNGHPAPEEGWLEDYMIKDGRSNTSRICTAETPNAKYARLYYKTKEKRSATSVVEVQLDTGRHHQIRVQMSHFGHPLVGDRKYGQEKSTEALRLCAYRLEFAHPETGNRMRFTIAPAF